MSWLGSTSTVQTESPMDNLSWRANQLLQDFKGNHCLFYYSFWPFEWRIIPALSNYYYYYIRVYSWIQFWWQESEKSVNFQISQMGLWGHFCNVGILQFGNFCFKDAAKKWFILGWIHESIFYSKNMRNLWIFKFLSRVFEGTFV